MQYVIACSVQFIIKPQRKKRRVDMHTYHSAGATYIKFGRAREKQCIVGRHTYSCAYHILNIIINSGPGNVELVGAIVA
jgi:hypothetical protein